MKIKFEDGVEDLFEAASAGRKVRDHGPYGIRIADERFDFTPLVMALPCVTGDQVLSGAGVGDPREWLLFQLFADGVMQEVRGDQTVDLRQPGAERFVMFRSDRSFHFLLNQRSFDWGAARISGGTLKKLADVDVRTHDVFQERSGQAPTLIEDAEFVDLAAPGVERFVTTPITIEIFVNTRPKELHQRSVSYWEVVKLAFPDAQRDERTVYTIDFAFGPHQNPEGQLIEGQHVCVKNGMKFYVTPTDRS